MTIGRTPSAGIEDEDDEYEDDWHGQSVTCSTHGFEQGYQPAQHDDRDLHSPERVPVN